MRFLYRPVELQPTLVPGIVNLIALLRGHASEDEPQPPPLTAIGRLNRSIDGYVPALADQVVDLAVGLEAALSGTSATEIAYRLRSRAALLLAQTGDPPGKVYDDVKVLYDIRSKIVHGAGMTSRKLQTQLESVSSAALAVAPGEVVFLAIDRWRDLLRRAIVCRIALAHGADPVWPIDKESEDVDRVLAADDVRSKWRATIDEFWVQVGLPDAPRPATAPQTLLRRDPSQRQITESAETDP